MFNVLDYSFVQSISMTKDSLLIHFIYGKYARLAYKLGKKAGYSCSFSGNCSVSFNTSNDLRLIKSNVLAPCARLYKSEARLWEQALARAN